MAQEPVAYQLYKARHFYNLSSKTSSNKKEKKGDIKNEVLKVANAVIIHKNKFKKIIDKHCEQGWTLKNRIINLPPKEEKDMRLRLEEAITMAKQMQPRIVKKSEAAQSQGNAESRMSSHKSS